MMVAPKLGTIERTVLDKLMDSPNGATYLDFPPELGMDEKMMDDIIQRLQNGIYESEDDGEIKLDS